MSWVIDFSCLCVQHPEPEDRVPLYEDLQGFWDMIKLQVDSVDDNFAEIDHMSQNGWKEIPKLVVSKADWLCESTRDNLSNSRPWL